MPSTSPAVSAPTSRATTMRCSVMNGGLPAAFSSAATAASRPSAPPPASGSSPAPARPGMVISSSASCGRRCRAARPPGRRRRGRATTVPMPLTRYAGALTGSCPSSASVMRQTATEPSTSWTRTMRHPWATPYATVASDAARRVVDVELEQIAEEPLVRRRQQQRVAVARQRVALAQQHGALRGCLAEVEAGVERDLLGREPGGLRPRGAVEQERGDVADQVVVVGLGIGDTRAATGCGWPPPTRRAWPRRRGSRGRRTR